jgi:hypothetical protein
MSSVAPDHLKPGEKRAETVKAARETTAQAPSLALPQAPAPTEKKVVKPGEVRVEAVKAARAAETAETAEAPSLAPAKEKVVKSGEKRAQAVRDARAKEEAKEAKEEKKTDENNSASVSSTAVDMGQEKPHLRTVDLPSANVNNSTVGESERNEENRKLENFEPDKLTESVEPVPEPPLNIPITSKADPTMFLLLRVGSDTTSEYIELRKQPIASMGGFNTHSIGSVKEFENLYGIKTPEGYKAMQRAFGVLKYGKLPPFIDYVHVKQCKFLGFDLVKEGLKNRIRTLGESVNMQNASMNRSRNSHFLEWLKEQVKLMDAIQKECAPITANATATATASAKAIGITGNTGCPCLEELSILRDLIYLVVTIEGSSSPEVKKQLDSIPLSKILNIAVKPAEKKTIILQAIEALAKISSAKSEVKKEELQPVLRTIWTALTKEVVTRDVTQQEILDRIGSLISKVQELEASKANALAISNEVDDSRKRLNALRKLLSKVETNQVTETSSSNNSEEVKRLKAQLEELTKDKPVIQHNNSEEVKQLKAQLEELSREEVIHEEEPFNSEEVKQLKARIQELTEEVATLEAKMAAAIADVNKRKNEVQKTLVSEEETRLKARVTELETNVNTLRTNRNKAIADATKAREALAEMEKELIILREKHEAESKENTSKKERISKELAAARAQLQELEEKISLAKEDDEAHRKIIENARANVERLKAELLKIEGPDNSKTNSLEEQIVKLKEELSKEKELKVTKEPAKISNKEIDVLKEQVQGLEDSIKSAIEKNNTATKERLNTLLGFLVIHDDMRVRAMQYWEAGNDSQRSEIASELSGEVCEFFKYFSNLINLQLEKIKNASVSDEIKEDVFSIFKSVPAFDRKILRKELGAIFQEIFIHMGNTTEIIGFSLKDNYPELYKILNGLGTSGNNPLTITLDEYNKFVQELGTLGFLAKMYLVPENNKINVKFSGLEDQGMPIVILTIKLIQLLKESLDEKYDDLTKRCSV